MRHPPIYFQESLTRLRREFRPRRRILGVTLDIFYFLTADLLLIFYMHDRWQTVSQRVPSIPLNIPVASSVEPVPLSSKVLTVSREGILFFDNERVSLAEVSERFRQMVVADPELTLIIEADKRVSHGDLMALYNKAMQAGVGRVALAARVPESLEDTP